MDKSRRSFMPDDGAAGFAGAAENDEKSPKPLDALGAGLCACVWEAGGDFGVESKKLPPPPNMLEDADVAFGLEKLSSPEKGDGLA
jgi:hypothetical protein